MLLADVVGVMSISHFVGGCLDRLVYHLVQLSNDVYVVGLLPVLLQALVNDVDRVAVGTVCVYAPDVDARLELLKHLATHHLEALASFVVYVCRLLARHDGGVALKAGLPDNIVQ